MSVQKPHSVPEPASVQIQPTTGNTLPWKRNLWIGLTVLGLLGILVGYWFWSEHRGQQQRRARLSQLTMFQPFRSSSQRSLFDWFTKMAPAAPTFAVVQDRYATWYQQPSSSLYGGNVGIWVVQDPGQPPSHLFITGTSVAPIQQKLVRLLYTLSGLEAVESEHSFINDGAASLAFDLSCPTDSSADEYIAAQRKLSRLWNEILVTPKGWKIRFLSQFQQSIQELESKPGVQKYLRCRQKKQHAYARFFRGIQWLQETTGMMQIHTIPATLWKEVQKTWAQRLQERDQDTLSFAPRLKQAGIKQAVASFPLYHRQQQSAVSFRLPRADFYPKPLQQVVNLALQEWKQSIRAMLQQQLVFTQAKQTAMQQELTLCQQWKEESSYDKRKVSLQEFCDMDGACRSTQIPEMTRFAYCQFYVPIQVKRLQSWLQDLRTWPQQVAQGEALQTAESWIESSIWDTMLRGISPSGFQYTRAMQAWSEQVRDHVWFSLYQNLVSRGLSAQMLHHSSLLFQVKREGKSIVISPIWVADLARSSWVWSRQDHTPQLKVDLLPSTEAGDVAPSQDPNKRFEVLQDPAGIQRLRNQGKLFETFSAFWTHHLPLKLSLGVAPTVGIRAQQTQALTEARRQFQWYRTLSKASESMNHSQSPAVSQVHLWIQSFPRNSPNRGPLSRVLQRVEEQGGRWQDPERLDAMLALTEEAQQTLRSIQQALATYERSRMDTPSLRLLMSRVHYEQGQFRKALDTLLYPKVALGFYHPDLTWKITSNDWTGKMGKIEADRILQTVVIKANSNGTYTQPILVVEGMPMKTAEDLVEAVGKAEPQPLSAEKASEQILALPVEVPSTPKQVFQQFDSTELFDMLLQDMIYTCHPPWKQAYPPWTSCQHPYFQPKATKEDDTGH